MIIIRSKVLAFMFINYHSYLSINLFDIWVLIIEFIIIFLGSIKSTPYYISNYYHHNLNLYIRRIQDFIRHLKNLINYAKFHQNEIRVNC